MPDILSIQLAQRSDQGVKTQNEDFYGALIPDDASLESKGIACAIADGMGSCSQAREASEHCVKSFLNDYFSTPETWSVKTSGAKVLTAINTWLLSNGAREQAHGMVTTFSAVVFKSTTAHIFHIGDSRIYRLRRQGGKTDFECLTTDHRVWISENKNYLSRAMGIDLHVDIDYRTVSIQPGDLFLMSTDGVHDYLDDTVLRGLLAANDDIDAVAAEIIQAALDAGSHDNVTCQIIRIESTPPQDPNEVYRQLSRLPFPPPMGPGMTIDGFEILEEIHASTTSQLYRVRDKESGRHYIMKTPSVNYSDDAAYIERFYMEEWAGKRIDHKAVLRIYELPRPRSFLYFIMECVEGQSLREWMRQNPMPDIGLVCELTDKIIQGLRAFHRMEMLHRDLKPENIMVLCGDDGHLDIKIIDFGSVKIAGVQEISTPVERVNLLGTKNYTAPEYLLGSEGSNRSDIFSLGVIVYEMLTGALPYGEKLSRELNWRSLNKIRYVSAIEHNPMIPLWLDGALRKAVSLDPRSRYETFSEFFFDLTHPNPAFMKQDAPLAERNPLLLWKLIAAALFAGHLVWLAVFFSQ